jgi:hypothetical protein
VPITDKLVDERSAKAEASYDVEETLPPARRPAADGIGSSRGGVCSTRPDG